MFLEVINDAIVGFAKRNLESMARFALFLSFFWFGTLKVLGVSPISGLVSSLLVFTGPSLPPETFLVLFGIFEVIIGIMFAIKGSEKIVFPLFLLHMIVTFLPLFLLPHLTWSNFLIPTLEGQYILKNFALITCALVIASKVKSSKQ